MNYDSLAEVARMNRRDMICAFGALSLQATVSSKYSSAFASIQQDAAAAQSGRELLPVTVAGVRLPDSRIARLATELSRSAYPHYLFNHASRTFLFGALVGRSLGQSLDEEILYLACILHDLGLAERFQGELPFEIQGAETAKRFLAEHGYDREKVAIVWDGIAMHASPIGRFKQPEIAMVGEGAGADVAGPDLAQIKKSDVEEILSVFPRLRFKTAFLKTCADVVRVHPRTASSSFMRDIRERYVPDFHPSNFCDRLAGAPFAE
jgi:hypothetical protein